ncbi:hypothetical protein VHA_001914 [Grimontia hollisae CIP 101886]|uniref:Uncharacterized protein n=1 Tax=Grimontia hollisae CIP 101886 TaxID=675812 RepID=D0I839_GRIHO|nr:hypothetical protein VHA_001914 [Grimontia hollisae CIP 101886]STO46778.1 Uncharacterised protein [Grimontia hollisae]
MRLTQTGRLPKVDVELAEKNTSRKSQYCVGIAANSANFFKMMQVATLKINMK